jgi:pimeloyl-ACP methyl ester carboxylesterase
MTGKSLFATLACTSFVITNAFAEAPTPNHALDVYATPGELVAIGNGKRLDLRCSGSGSPTVILESGAITDSMTWSDLQPLLAKTYRVCSYDRAGYGFSEGAAKAPYIQSTAQDLHALMQAAKIARPVVLVGHSLGTNIVREYASKFPADVLAIVLLDPPAQNFEGVSADKRAAVDKENVATMDAIAGCGRKAANSPPELQGCLRPPDPRFTDALNAAQRASKSRPAFWESIGNALRAGRALDREPVPATETHGAIPLLILQPDNPFDDEPAEDRAMIEAARIKTHKAIAAMSTRGEIIAVAHSSHDVQNDRPRVVVDAVKKAVGMAGKGR